MMRRGPLALWLAGALSAAACSGAATDTSSPDDVASVVAVEPSPTSDAATSELADDAAVEAEAFVAGLHDDVIVQTTPVSGGGDRPVLAWEEFDGAADYLVVVHDPDDQPYWAWTTADTQVRVGLTERPDTAPGPRVAEGTSWVVIARDAEGVPLASSPRRPIAP